MVTYNAIGIRILRNKGLFESFLFSFALVVGIGHLNAQNQTMNMNCTQTANKASTYDCRQLA